MARVPRVTKNIDPGFGGEGFGRELRESVVLEVVDAYLSADQETSNRVAVRNSFVSIYFLTSNSFFPRTLISPAHVLTLTMIPPHVAPLLFHFAFTNHTIPNHREHQRSRFEEVSKTAKYLLAKILFARHLLPPDPVSKALSDRQTRQSRSPLFDELVMRLYISRYRVQRDS